MRLMLIGILLVALSHTGGAHAQVSIETQDGLKLSFGDSGNVSEVRIGEQTLPLLEKSGGFFVTDIERSKRNLMPDGDFETGAGIKEQGWQLEGSWKIAEENGQRFAQAFLETTEGSGNIRSPRVPVEPETGYLLTAQIRTASDADKFAPGLYIVQYDAQGQVVKVPTSGGEAVQIGVSVPRSVGKFTQVSTTFVTQPRTATVQVYANIYRSAGRFDLDAVWLEPIEAAPTSFQGKMQPTNKGAAFSGSSKELGLILEATFTSYSDHIRVDGMVRDTTGEDRPLRVGFHLPVDARGWTWWDDIEESRQIAEGQRYANYGSDWSVGKGRQVSVFPFASVTGNSSGLSLAQRVDQPRFFRIFYDPAAGYCLDYNLGLAAETTKFPSSASFHFLIYRHDPEWGMRAAAQRYYDIFPELFRVRAERQGLYCYDVPTDLSNPEDFGFCFDLAGFGYTGRKKLQEHGIYLLVHPMGTEAHIRWPEDYDWGTKSGRPSLEQIEDIFFTRRPEYKEGPSWQGLTQRHQYTTFEENRQRVMNSAVHGPDGRFRLYPYSDTIQFIATSANPEIPSPNMVDGERSRIRRHMEIAAKAGSQLDGVDFDNIAITAGRTRENFRREHFQYVDHPLIYNLQTRRVCIQTGMDFYEFVKEISDEMHAQGKLCTGNVGSDPHTQTIFGHLLDKHGGEVQYHAPTKHLRAYRTMAYQKPVSHIIYSGAVSAGQEEIVMHRWLAFGEFPTITELAYRGGDFEKGRPLYKRFIPAMQRIAYAGWEPLTHASVNVENMFVERFGNWSDGDLHFTVHNDSDEPRTCTLVVDKTALGVTGKPAWVELLSDKMVSADDQVQVELQPHHTKVFNLFPPEQGDLDWWRGPFILMADGGGRVLKNNAVIIHAMVKGAAQDVQTDMAPPPGWTAQPLAERERSWRLLPQQDAQEGEAEVTARVTSQDGRTTVLRRTVQLIPAAALELATDKLDLTLNVPYQIRVPVRNNSGGLLSVAIKIDLPESFEMRSVEGAGEVPSGSVAVIGLTHKSPLEAQPGVYKAAVSLGENRYTVRLNARKGLLARRLASPPTLDGVLNEWTVPPSADEFRLLGTTDMPTQDTQVWIGYDESALYLVFRCAEDKIGELRSAVTGPDDGVWSDDDVAIFLDPGASRGTYYQFEINSLGTIYDSFNNDNTWSSGATAAGKTEADAWTLEVAIPWSGFGKNPQSGDRWGINLGRQEKPHSETSTITTTFKDVSLFADLIFE